MARLYAACLAAFLATFSLAEALDTYETYTGFSVDEQGCVDTFQENKNYFPDVLRLVVKDAPTVAVASGEASKTTATVAEDFSVTYFPTYKILRNYKDNNRTYVLQQCGTPEVKDEDLPAYAAGAARFQVPVKSWSAGVSTPIVFLDLLGLNHRAHVVDMSYITSPCLHKLAECGKNGKGGHVHIASSDSEYKAAITNGTSELHFTDSWGTGAVQSSKDVAFDATTDPGLINRAEWIKFISVFFNLEPLANQIFSDIERRFNRASSLLADAVKKNGNLAPSVAFVEQSTWDGVSWVASNAAYKLDMISHAGGKVHKSGEAAYFTTVQEMKDWLAGVDCIVDETYASNPTEYSMSNFTEKFGFTDADATSGDYPFLANKCVIRLDKRLGKTAYGSYGYDWHESAIGHPDIIVSDLATFLHPGVLDHETRYMRNIARNEGNVIVLPDQCADPYAVCDDETAPPTPPPSINTFLTTAPAQKTAPVANKNVEKASAGSMPGISCVVFIGALCLMRLF